MREQRPASSEQELARLTALIDAWTSEQVAEDWVVAVERPEADKPLWFVRCRGEEKGVFTVWFMLRQRSLFVETYFMPAPEQEHAAVYEYLLRRNLRLFGAKFSIGNEDAVYLTAEVHNEDVSADELDRLLGTAYMETEQSFRPAMRLGFGSKFQG
ncbi:MAG: YbjN domain-containing protein [Actinobacteria bacterium]|nr:YbjN domain-containing protein [Actinomycetota bacterium]